MSAFQGEEYGFPRSFFPVSINGHRLHIIHNDAHNTVDDRLQLHLTIHCPRCDEERTVRGRLPPRVESYNYRAALAKFVAFGHFKEECTGSVNHTYYKQ